MLNLRVLSAMALFVGTFAQLLISLRLVTRRSLGVVLPMAAAVFVALESTILNLLSLAHAVQAFPVALAHVAVIVALGKHQLRHFPGEYIRFARLVRRRAAACRLELMLAPLLCLLFVTAYFYPPNNWDSMTYHMARVAHWMDNRSVAYFPATQEAQNTMGPGAEYLLLLLQIIGFSDLWANMLQLFAYCLLLVSVPEICRLLGLPRRLAPWAAIFVASVPILTLEATTTQNDVVAGVMTLATVAAALPLLSRSRQPRAVDVFLFAIACASTYLVKPTATLAAIPIALVGSFALLARLRASPRRLGIAILGGLALVVVILGPDSYRKLTAEGSLFAGRNEIYPVLGEWGERAFNTIRTLCQNALAPTEAGAQIEKWETRWLGTSSRLYCQSVYAYNEDRVGNPLHMLVAILTAAWLPILALVSLFRRRARPRRALLVGSTVVAAWILVHGFVRNQEFISRLQIPLFAMLPMLWPAFVGRSIPGAKVRAWLLQLATLACLAFGFVCAVQNQFRPIDIWRLRDFDREGHYYDPDTRIEKRLIPWAAFKKIESIGCKRVGLLLEPQGFDYPFTWHAMRAGIAVRPYVGPSRWPCLVYTELGEPPSDSTFRWTPLSDGVWTQGRKP